MADDPKLGSAHVFLHSIGCRLNQSEMDSLARQLAGRNFQLVRDPAAADLFVLNTCAVTGEAERKSRQAARRLQRANPDAQMILTGCYATLDPAAATADLPATTQVVDNAAKEQLLALIAPDTDPPVDPHWPLPGGRTRAFVKAQDGCDNACSYCITTLARGPGVSRPLPEVVAEIQALEAAGYQEVVLTGVHLGSYGQDAQGAGKPARPNLSNLVQAILARSSIPRLRLSSLEPWDLQPGFYQLWQNPRLCRQLHLPLQSGSAGVLRRMARQTSPDAYRALAAAALEAIPDLALTTDLIVGFPGETEDEFEESMALVGEIPFARLHVFGYSPRPGTVAAQMAGQLPAAVIRGRSQQMRSLGAEKQEAFLRRFLGRTMDVLWESPAGGGRWRGHTDNYIPVTAAGTAGWPSAARMGQLRNTITPTLLVELRPGEIVGQVLTAP